MGQAAAARTNKFAAKCGNCGGNVPERAGVLTKEDGKWVTRHPEGTCGADAAPAATEAAAAPEFTPTAEQQSCLDLFATGHSMVIEAGAGTGKTATLKLLAQATDRRGQYIAFNRSIVDEAATKFPANVACNTAHSLAFRAVGKQFAHRLKAPRMKSDVLARLLNVNPITVTVGNAGRKTLAAGFLAGHVMQSVTRFCQSADPEPTRRHVPYIEGIDLPTPEGRRTFANNDEIATALLPAVKRAWADLSRTDGALPYRHDHYLKAWQLGNPRINADFILFDEAQDANPVMAAIVAAQDHAQVVYVGDSQQAIYEFTGAVNALGQIDSEHRVFLTQSFRFGPALADFANVFQDMLDAELHLVGTPTIDTRLGLVEREDAILCRTNAHAVETVLNLQEQNRRPYLVGGGSEVVAFAKAARDLMDLGHTGHPELACFDSWNAVREYVENDSQGGELKLMVSLVDKFGVPTILAALDHMPAEAAADVVVSTAHRAKGREWGQVRLGTDFPTEADKLSDQELRLLYVAVTRAQGCLDASSVMAIFEEPEDDDVVAADEVDAAITAWVDGEEDDA